MPDEKEPTEYNRFDAALRQILSAPKESGKQQQAKPKSKKRKKKD